MNEIILILISSFLILVGLVGTILPFLPGPPLSLAGLILYGWFTKFETVSILAVVIFSILTLFTFLFDIFAPALAAKGYRSSKYGAWGAVIGVLLGIVVLGPIGAFLGPFLGAFVGEFIAQRNHQVALRAAWGAFVGILIGTIFKLTITLAMLGYFIIKIIT
ncbi:MAG: hypothetical protein A3B10_02140 [Candidatus Doudnabacteria bacterium RIFCSPLOWO2_01_FULL_44_21]|uniref:DUF456 domain-containing protein n=1 Tax=Candidatus Doudnabacteria bacterium RIFCSPLOWO2_01_FULL_44_21 TaxID=1817841 RepID=A0A1F5Q5Z8_9BACT|nr:MAG: hypothetical protein A3B95_00250 [Candidatus Doudnabacteria bacterium RIFCSPHIGHO2_02_FULL_43_13b]OGE97372.1 MAG: hypothetical protein A3B10_02140 [Candidatus Doudnabacteria bacterium RIFCSPLOWO2_01_FULL_44_21]